ncbi:glycosyltransferase [Paenibacillus typhae]|uniref:glycosyltransferase n=1 Tax=Paenibacillus typhae TaxID=1174501 RepID=UPI001C8D2248|nr:glycosyltransferase [Paenibacillus typhae]MBY0014737.1 glycosyltransferase [Paenibacillus typhae]
MRERMLYLSARNRGPEEEFEEETRTEGMIGILLEKFDIDLLEYCSYGRKTRLRPDPALKIHAVTPSPRPHTILRNSLNKLRGSSYHTDTHKALQNEIRHLCKNNDYSHVYITRGVPGSCVELISSLLPEAFIITDALYLESRHSEGKAAGKRGLSKRYHMLNAVLSRRDERRLMNRTGLLLTASEWEALSFKALSFADAGKVHVVPQFIDLDEYRFSEPAVKEDAVLLHWNMQTSQGKNTALTFLKKVFPLIKEKVPGCKCYIAGPEIHPEVAALANLDSSVQVIEVGSAIQEYIRRSKAVVASLREGCGGQLRILEAWALRTPVVTGQKSAEGLNCEPGRNILLAGTTGEMADQVLRLLQTPELGPIIADQAYRTLQKHYEAGNVRAKVLSLI